jgi:hypothetical protein
MLTFHSAGLLLKNEGEFNDTKVSCMDVLEIVFAKTDVELDRVKGEMLIRLSVANPCDSECVNDAHIDAVRVPNSGVGQAVRRERDFFNDIAESLRDSFNQLNKPRVAFMSDSILMQGNDGHTMPFFDFKAVKNPDSSVQGAA